MPGLYWPIGFLVRRCSLILGFGLVFAGCSESDRSVAPTLLSDVGTVGEGLDASSVSTIVQADFSTSPPTHPTLGWAELAPMIEAAAVVVESLPRPERPDLPMDPLAERLTSVQASALSEARDRALVLRAEAGRRVALGDFDGAADALIGVLGLAGALSEWGVPAAAEASASLIELVLDALESPARAPVVRAMSPPAQGRLRDAFASLGRTDPAGRVRAMVESSTTRIAALRSRAMGTDGPTVARAAAIRYTPGSGLSTPDRIDAHIREAEAFVRALGDSWDRPMRSAVSKRLRDRQREDESGVLVLLLGHAPDACEADALLRERIAHAIGALR